MHEGPRHRTGGRAGRMAARLAAHVEAAPFLTRSPEAVRGPRRGGPVAPRGERRHDPRGGRHRVPGRPGRPPPPPRGRRRRRPASSSASRAGCAARSSRRRAPRTFTQHARNPERSVQIGDPYTVLAPNYGSPFVRDLDNGRRYGTIEDFRNFVKLTYMSPYLHHSGGTVCEPVDVPVNKRHLDMVYSHIRYSDKPFMGSVTHPSRAADTVEMARILFGAEYLEDHTVILSLINANSPLVWDSTMLGAARVYAESNQATLITPFILAGAMSPVTVAGTARPDARRGAGRDDLRPARPARGAGHPRQLRVLDLDAVAARRRSGRRSRRSSCTSWPRSRGGSASRSGRAATSAPRRSPTPRRPTNRRPPSSRRSWPASTSSSTPRAGSRAAWRSATRSSSSTTTSAGWPRVFVNGVDLSPNGQALDAIRENGPGPPLPRQQPHPGQLRDGVLPLRDRRQQLLRAVARGRRPRCRPAGQPDLEADARRVRGAAARRRDRRGAPRVHRPAQGLVPGLGGLIVAFLRRGTLRIPARAGPARRAGRRAREPDLRAHPAQERGRPVGRPAGRARPSRSRPRRPRASRRRSS